MAEWIKGVKRIFECPTMMNWNGIGVKNTFDIKICLLIVL